MHLHKNKTNNTLDMENSKPLHISQTPPQQENIC
jgi:hypothetical protein